MHLKYILRKLNAAVYCMLLRWIYEVSLWKNVKSWFRLVVLRINFVFLQIDFVFLWITLRNLKKYLWNLQIKTFLLLEFLSSGKPQSFCLHFNLNNLLYLNCTLFSCISIAFSSQTPNGWAYSTPSYPLDVGTTH